MFVLGGMIICTGRRRKMTLGKIELLLAEVIEEASTSQEISIKIPRFKKLLAA